MAKKTDNMAKKRGSMAKKTGSMAKTTGSMAKKTGNMAKEHGKKTLFLVVVCCCCMSLVAEMDAVKRLSRVGLNKIPAWCKPYHVLSNGEQSRRSRMDAVPGRRV